MDTTKKKIIFFAYFINHFDLENTTSGNISVPE